MRQRTIALTTLAALLTMGAWIASADEPADGDAVDWTAKAREAWAQTCRKCHAVPDTRFETDRAFLRQITETS